MKKNTRNRLLYQCQVHWNDFDPIGVIDIGKDGFDDPEYSSYLWRTLELLLVDADKQKLTKHVETCVYGHMGLSRSAPLDDKIGIFVDKLLKARWE